ncbi:MAG: four-carbon acid sugar kinase family protein, partial [Limisphaerales bacterium]
VEAVLAELRYKRALMAPANPSLGRVIQGGRYWVRGRLIHRTEFAQDPEYPRKSCQVLDLLKPHGRLPIRIMPHGPIPDSGIIVGEAATPADVHRWAGFLDKQTLPVGGADFFNASLAAEKRNAPGQTEEIPSAIGRRELFICGTPSKAARQFLRSARLSKTPVFSLPSELSWGAEFTPAAMTAIGRRVVAAFESHERVVLCVGLPLVRESRTALRLSACLAQVAAFVLRRADVDRVYAEGGMTATDVVRRMCWRRLSVVRELAPGVAVLAVEGNLSKVLIIKPGSYQWPQL